MHLPGQRVGWVERKRYPSIASCEDDGFRRLNPSYALPIPSAHEAAGCNGHPASPRPLWAENSSSASGASRGEVANVRLVVIASQRVGRMAAPLARNDGAGDGLL